MNYEQFLEKNYPHLLKKIKKEKRRNKLSPYEESATKNQEFRSKFKIKK